MLCMQVMLQPLTSEVTIHQANSAESSAIEIPFIDPALHDTPTVQPAYGQSILQLLPATDRYMLLRR